MHILHGTEQEMASSKKTASSSSKTAPVAPPPETVPPPPPPPSTVDDTVPQEVAKDSQESADTLDSRFDGLLEQLNNLATTVRGLQLGLKSLARDYSREAKKVRRVKGGAPKPNAQARRSPSGFTMPSALSKELCTFLKIDVAKQLARVEVTRLINAYIKENNLQDPSDKRKILPNAALAAILSPSDAPLTYFNLQSRIKHHFVVNGK